MVRGMTIPILSVSSVTQVRVKRELDSAAIAMTNSDIDSECSSKFDLSFVGKYVYLS